MTKDNLNVIENNLSAKKSMISFSPGSYIELIQTNRNYRFYLLSHMCQHIGDWFIRIASLIAVGRMTRGSSIGLSKLIMCKTLPEVFLTPVGGVLADRFDRRKTMIKLDMIAGMSVLSYIFAVRSGNVNYLFFVTVVRSSIQAIYDPTTKSIVPMFTNDPEELKRAATLNGMMWSGMLVIGGVFSGYASALIGVESCYLLDSVTYFISAVIMSKVQGDFKAAHTNHKQKNEKKVEHIDCDHNRMNSLISPLKTYLKMSNECIQFLLSCGFGALIFLKGSGSMIWGAADVLNVSFSHVDDDEAESSRRLGILYSCIGIGCLISPIVANSTFVDGRKPHTLQIACIGAMSVMSIGWFGVAKATSFSAICAFTSIRTIGSAIIWLNSTLLLQTLAPNQMLGRALGLEYSIARCSEAVMAFAAGALEDSGYTNSYIASLSSIIGVILFILWSHFHITGNGAGNEKIFPSEKKDIEMPLCPINASI